MDKYLDDNRKTVKVDKKETLMLKAFWNREFSNGLTTNSKNKRSKQAGDLMADYVLKNLGIVIHNNKGRDLVTRGTRCESRLFGVGIHYRSKCSRDSREVFLD